ncbi:MAG: TolC family protein [Desulfobacteraceae bacterium]|nr:TolC family protein [Desulfobacteraceae bacterium]
MIKVLSLITLGLIVMMQPFAIAYGDEDLFPGKVSEREIGALIESIEALKAGEAPPGLSLEECLDIALKKNRQREVSALAVRIAQYQHKQALSAYWPKLFMNSSFSRVDEDLNFVFPEETSTYSIAGMSISDISLGPGMPSLPPIALPPQSVSVTIPEKTIKVLDRDSLVGSLELSMPIYTGGIRSAIAKQAELGIKAARHAARRTDLQLIYDVKKMYYGAVLAEVLHKIGKNALARLKTTLDLTERLYKDGSGAVTKADYLRTKVILGNIRSVVSIIESNRNVSRAALVNTMGLSWNSRFDLSEKEIPFLPCNEDVGTLVGSSYKFNPNWKRLLTALEAAEARIREEKGERMPKFMLTGSMWKMHRSYDGGIQTDENLSGWKLGLGMQIPVFNGFLTENKIREARTRLNKLKKEQILLKEGIALQINYIFLMMKGFQKQQAASLEALRSASENRELNIRAYESELVETGDVIEAQLMEALMNAQYHKARFNYAEARFHLDFLVGNEIEKLLGGNYQ